MSKEVQDHEEREHWALILRPTIPAGVKTIQAIWSFKRKRFPDGTLNKHKARLCAHGGMQQWGKNYWETYSPVVNMLNEGDIDKFLGIEIKHLDDKRSEMSQPFLIERICTTLGLMDNDWDSKANSRRTPVGKPVLN
ncbi:hypothetical protein ACHAXN_005720 [Cyclotella atomus]